MQIASPLASLPLVLAVGISDIPPAQMHLEIMENQSFRAIFCAAEGTELSAPYARALLRDIHRFEHTGLTARQAIERMYELACVSPVRVGPSS